jgi:hypothetical protein
MNKVHRLRSWIRYGKPAFEGYTFDQDVYKPITGEDFESVTVLDSPADTEISRRWDRFKPNRKAQGYK